MEKLSIGKMAKLNQTTVQALRLYDKMELLKPMIVNDTTGYRYYDVKQSAQLDMIHYMKSAGMTLKEIKQTFDKNDYLLLNQVLQKHFQQIEQEIKELNYQKKAVKRMIGSYSRYMKSPPDGTLTFEYIEERKIYSSMTGINFYEQGLDSYEGILKELKKVMEEHGIPEFYYFNAGTTIYKDDFLACKCLSKEIFVFVDQDCQSSYLHVLPANMYVCMYCDDFEKEKSYILKLQEFIKTHDLEVVGDYICEVLTELPMISSRKREMFIRLQVPIAFVKKQTNLLTLL